MKKDIQLIAWDFVVGYLKTLPIYDLELIIKCITRLINKKK